MNGILYQDASRDNSSIPRCSIGLNLNVRGKGTLAVGGKTIINSVQYHFNTIVSGCGVIILQTIQDDCILCRHRFLSNYWTNFASSTSNMRLCRAVNVPNKLNLLMTKPENAQLIHPPITIMGSTLVRFPFIMSVSMLVSEKGSVVE